jgi:hypothetical protein
MSAVAKLLARQHCAATCAATIQSASWVIAGHTCRALGMLSIRSFRARGGALAELLTKVACVTSPLPGRALLVNAGRRVAH